MQPNHHQEVPAGSELPQLDNSNGEVFDYAQPAAPESRGQRPVSAAVPSPSIPMPLAPSAPISSSVSNPAAVTPSPSSSTLTADDADLIEKEWVLKAKAIVMHTKNDPRAQNIQMNGVKADYLKKRYNKDLKVNET